MDPSQYPPVMRRELDSYATDPQKRRSDHSDHSAHSSYRSTGSYQVDESEDGQSLVPPSKARLLIDRATLSSDMDNYMQGQHLLGESPSTHGAGHHFTPTMEDRMRRKLKFFFMNPCEKWKAKRRLPWKLTLQLLKIILVTVQLALFGYDRAQHVTFVEKNTIVFKHLFLKDWEASHETLPYPPAIGAFAIYRKQQFFDGVDFTLREFNKTDRIAIGSYFTEKRANHSENDVTMCKTFYKLTTLAPGNQTYEFNKKVIRDCFKIGSIEQNTTSGETKEVFDTKAFLEQHNKTVNFDRLIKVEIKLALRAIHLKNGSPLDAPDCCKFDVTITYDNSGHNGQIPVDLKALVTRLECRGKMKDDDHDTSETIALTLFDAIVIIASVLSTILCLRSIIRAQRLRVKTVIFFKNHLGKTLSVYDELEFLNLWYILIIFNDLLTIIGSIYKIRIENKTSSDYEMCGLMLGTGNLLVWFGVLRYLGFFEKYNILILTMKRSAPNIMRFLVCAIVFYFGFTLCGWVVLGPYHMKFRSLGTASECLFSLVNGDDMFVTFSIIGQDSNSYIWYYSRVYLYTFISLFIYVVLSLFIAVIMDTYETIKHYYEHGFPKSDLMEFVDECQDHPTSPLYRADVMNSKSCLLACCVPCCRRPEPVSPNEYTPIMNSTVQDT